MMRKRIAALLLSVAVVVSGMTLPVMAEDFSDSAVVSEQEIGGEQDPVEVEEDAMESENPVEDGAEVSVEEEDEDSEQTDSEAAENLLDDGEENIFGGEEEEFFTSEETLPDAGTVGGKCFGYIIESPKHFFVL